ncbi:GLYCOSYLTRANSFERASE BC10 [Salix purpurea]|uniref:GLYCOSYLTRANSFERASE BC10 n=1 Tax=Salix purpurea TaxID=77065 RepID=A0A9Q0VSM2_SALPP|nr:GLYCOSYLTRANSFERASE BC10 [Salix purpurea]
MKQRKSTHQKSVYYYNQWKKRKIFVMLSLLLLTGSCFVLTLNSTTTSTTTTRNRLPLDMLWDAFFKGQESRFSIFVHSRPGFLFNKANTRSEYFLNRQVNDSTQVDWGEATMIEAERILLRHALVDPLNERFVFLSDSCIPLYNFSYTYDYIMSTSTSFVDSSVVHTVAFCALKGKKPLSSIETGDMLSGMCVNGEACQFSSFADTKEGRYNPKMAPLVPVNNWRKGSQWVVLTRKHAEVVVNDTTVFPMFQQHCKRRSLPEFWRDHPIPADTSMEHNCIPDEHYVQTLLAREGLEGEITRRSLTHSSWDLSSSKDPERRGWHPVTYKFSDATPMLIQSIKELKFTLFIYFLYRLCPGQHDLHHHAVSTAAFMDIDNIYYETEYRREWCSSKGKPSRCFLFARKFTRPAAFRLLDMSVLGSLRKATNKS